MKLKTNKICTKGKETKIQIKRMKTKEKKK